MKKSIYIIIILFGLLTLSILGSSFKITEGNYSNENKRLEDEIKKKRNKLLTAKSELKNKKLNFERESLKNERNTNVIQGMEDKLSQIEEINADTSRLEAEKTVDILNSSSKTIDNYQKKINGISEYINNIASNRENFLSSMFPLREGAQNGGAGAGASAATDAAGIDAGTDTGGGAGTDTGGGGANTDPTDSENPTLRAALQKLTAAKEELDKAEGTAQKASEQNNVEMAIQAVITAATASDQATEARKLAMKEKCKGRILEQAKNKGNDIDEFISSFSQILDTMNLINGHCDNTKCPSGGLPGADSSSSNGQTLKSNPSSVTDSGTIASGGGTSSKNGRTGHSSLTEWYNNVCTNEEMGKEAEGPFNMWDSEYY